MRISWQQLARALLVLLAVLATGCGGASPSPAVTRFARLSNEICREISSPAGETVRTRAHRQELRALERRDRAVPAIRHYLAERERLLRLEASADHHPYLVSHGAAEQLYSVKLKLRADAQALGLECAPASPAKPTAPFTTGNH